MRMDKPSARLQVHLAKLWSLGEECRPPGLPAWGCRQNQTQVLILQRPTWSPFGSGWGQAQEQRSYTPTL